MSLIRVRKLDSDHDMVFGKGRQDYCTDIYAVAQIIHTMLLLFTNEWWEDLKDGLPMWNKMLGIMGVKKQVLDSIIMERVKAAPYVKSIKSLTSELDVETRSYTVQMTVDTKFGDLTVTNAGG